jgi:hypothetical protein
LAPIVGITTTGFCYPGGILQLFHREGQQIFETADSSSGRIIIFNTKIASGWTS